MMMKVFLFLCVCVFVCVFIKTSPVLINQRNGFERLRSQVTSGPNHLTVLLRARQRARANPSVL